MVNEIGIDNIEKLFNLKRADLLAQSSDYHYLLNNISIQRQNIVSAKKQKK